MKFRNNRNRRTMTSAVSIRAPEKCCIISLHGGWATNPRLLLLLRSEKVIKNKVSLLHKEKNRKRVSAILLVRWSAQCDLVTSNVKTFILEIVGDGPVGTRPTISTRWAHPRLASRSLRVIVLLTPTAKTNK